MDIYFNHLPVEIRMMIFDHLVTDKSSLGTICKVSYNWKTIIQNSYAWKLWVNAIIGKNSQPKDKFYILSNINPIINPIYDIQLAPNDMVSNHVKTLLTKKFLFYFLDSEKIRKKVLEIWYGLFFMNNLQLIQLLQKSFYITADEARAKTNYALRLASANGHLEVVKYLHTQFELTADDARAGNNISLIHASAYGHLEVAKYLHSAFHLTTDDARSQGNAALSIASQNGHLLIIEYLHKQFNLTADDVRTQNNHALCLASKNGHLAIIKYLNNKFDLKFDVGTRIGYNLAINQAIIYGHLDVIKHLYDGYNDCIKREIINERLIVTKYFDKDSDDRMVDQYNLCWVSGGDVDDTRQNRYHEIIEYLRTVSELLANDKNLLYIFMDIRQEYNL